MIPLYIIIALFISFCWGLLPVIHKHVLTHLHPITIITFSAIIYTFLIIIYSTSNKRIIIKDIKNITYTDALILIFSASVATFAANVLYYNILKNHESSTISALIYSSPIFTLILAYFFLNERINTMGIIGILFIIVGVICIAMNNGTSKEFEYFSMV